VVIAIISLLLAMLFPALRQVKQAARTAVCGSNQRTVGVALFNYAGDNRAWLPISRYQGTNNVCSNFWGDLAYYDPDNNQPPASDRSSEALINLGLLWATDFIGDGKALYCPMQPDQFRQYAYYDDPWPTEQWVAWATGGYLLPGFSFNSEPEDTTVIWQAVRRKYERTTELDRQTVLLSDVLSNSAIAHPGPAFNVLWHDGRVTFVAPDDIEDDLAWLEAQHHKYQFQVIPDVLDELRGAQ
jgi:type II secretory pathway pseudopilin PulG